MLPTVEVERLQRKKKRQKSTRPERRHTAEKEPRGQQASAGTIATLPLALIQVSANKALREGSLGPRKLITIYLDRYRSRHAVIGLGMGSGVSKWGSFWGKYSVPENEIDKGKVPFLPVEDR